MAELDAPAWQFERSRLEQRQGFPFPDVVGQTPTEDEFNTGLLGDQWRIAVLRMLSAHAGKSVYIGRPLAIVLDCRRGEEVVPTLQPSLRRYLDVLEAGRWIWRAERGVGKDKDERVEVLFSLYDPPPTWVAGCRMRVWPDPPIVEYQLHGPGGETVVREVDRQHNVSLEHTIPFYPSRSTARGSKRLKSATRRRRWRWWTERCRTSAAGGSTCDPTCA